MYDILKNSINESTNHPVGAQKIPRYRLPPIDHVYGYHPNTKEEGVGAILHKWKNHVGSKPDPPRKNFIRINQQAIGHKNGGDNTMNDIEKQKYKKLRNITKSNSAANIKNMSFGVKNRASTPIDKVINFEYGNKAEKEMLKKYDKYFKERSSKKNLESQLFQKYSIKNVSENKKKEEEESQPKKLYKMKMFRNIKARVILPPKCNS